MPDQLLIAILAAGASRRLGQPKQLVPLNGHSLIRHQCLTALHAPPAPVAVILGCHHERISLTISDLNIQLILNPGWQEGLASSVRAATRAAITLRAKALLLYHCDQYTITPQDLIRLHQSWISSPNTAHLSRDAAHLGPPAILPARLFPSMLTLKGDTGPRAILTNPDILEVPMPSASTDLD